MKINIVGFTVFLLISLLLIRFGTSNMLSRKLIRPGERLTVVLNHQSENTADTNFLTKKLAMSYDKINQSYNISGLKDLNKIKLTTALLAVKDQSNGVIRIFTLAPIASGYSMLISFVQKKQPNCTDECAYSVRLDFEIKNNLATDTIDPKLCPDSGCIFLGAASYEYLVKQSEKQFSIRFPNKLHSPNIRELIKELSGNEFVLANSIQETKEEEEFTYSLDNDSEEIPEFVITVGEMASDCLSHEDK